MLQPDPHGVIDMNESIFRDASISKRINEQESALEKAEHRSVHT